VQQLDDGQLQVRVISELEGRPFLRCLWLDGETPVIRMRVRGAAEEAEIAGDGQLDVIRGKGHGRRTGQGPVDPRGWTRPTSPARSARVMRRWSADIRVPSAASAQAR